MASALVASLPATAASTRVLASDTRTLMFAMQALRLLLIKLYCPLYSAVIGCGMLPLDILST
ncbi:secreted protein [Candidatus Magnetobacterium bavaricum]|uniref:Secreted protein n=1 Tax=Candidatus Magnetobacterium bavaricum TaxID=29290 RepID=A0A0F3GZI5_9BACT|nr:secreted protein [Candidatus Magnetobacterium bavaricum]